MRLKCEFLLRSEREPYDAQDAHPEALAALKAMTNIESDSQSRIAFILVGQPELASLLSLSHFESVRERIRLAARSGWTRRSLSAQYVLHVYTNIVYTGNVKNITLSADEKLIEAARKKARASNRTLNEEFRRWLEQYTGGEDRAAEALAVMERISSYAGTGGRKFSRDEMNER